MDDELISALADAMGGNEELQREPNGHGLNLDLTWRPNLNPTQRKVFDCRTPYILAYGPRGSGKCIQSDAIIYTSEGLRRLRSFGDTSKSISSGVISFDGKQICHANASALHVERSRTSKTIVFSNGSRITCSPWHPIWGAYKEGSDIRFGYLTAADIQSKIPLGFSMYVPVFSHPGFTKSEYVQLRHYANRTNGKLHDEIEKHTEPSMYSVARHCGTTYNTVRDHRANPPKPWNTPICEDIAYLIGVLIGDGGMTNDTVILTTADNEILTGITPGLSKLGASIYKQNGNEYGYTLKGDRLSSLMRTLKLRCLSIHKRIPDEILESPRSVLISLLRGLFDTDGTTDKLGAVSYCTASSELAMDVHIILQSVGLFATRIFKKNKKNGAWIISLYGDDARNFRSVVGFKVSRKQARIRMNCSIEQRSCYGYPRFVIGEMKSIKNSKFNRATRRGRWKLFEPKRTPSGRWEVSGCISKAFFYESFDSIDEALAFAKAKNESRQSLPGETREWHHKHKSTLSSKYVPTPSKLKKFTSICGTSPAIDQMRVSDRWIKVQSISESECDLMDLCVDETHSFVANSLINHNTQVGLHSMVRHCVNNRNALGFIIVREVGVATEGGAWETLMLEVLPQWKRGNFDRKSGKFIDSGCGIEFTASKLDPLDKKPYTLIANRYGGYSMIKLLSLYVGHAVEDKVKGKTPSFVLCDEAQTFESDAYLTKLGQQVGRRQNISDVQQIFYSCNPKGPSHWIYRSFFCHGTDDEGAPRECPIDEDTGHPINPDTDQPVKNFSVFWVKTQENLHNLPDGYWSRVIDACKNDPIEHARMVEGQWIDKPEGDALFKDAWNDQFHIRGDLRKVTGIIPDPNHLFIIGWDPGSAHTSVHMGQFIVTPDKLFWNIFDELNFVGKYITYRSLVPKLIKRLQFWEGLVSEESGKKAEFKFEHISDESAFNQFRAAQGSFDAQDIEDISKRYVEDNHLSERFIIKMKACPKAPHSVEARVRLVTDHLLENTINISAICQKTREMFMRLEMDKGDRLKPKKPSPYSHPFDSLSYPILFYSAGAGRFITKARTWALEKTQFFRVGG